MSRIWTALSVVAAVTCAVRSSLGPDARWLWFLLGASFVVDVVRSLEARR